MELPAPEAQPAEMLRAWSSSAWIEGPLPGGHRNRLWAVRLHGRRYAARLSPRPPAALDWEIELLVYLRTAGMSVPDVVKSRDGHSRLHGLVVFSWLDGDPPVSDEDWRLVAAELSRLHSMTRAWPQRPTFHSTVELLTEEEGGDVRLACMPEAVVREVRATWHTIAQEATSVVHGDPGARNIRLQSGKAGFIDWDEARVDVSLLDLAAVPSHCALPIPGEHLTRARRAATAWEVANGWIPEPAYARRRLAELVAPAGTQPTVADASLRNGT